MVKIVEKSNMMKKENSQQIKKKDTSINIEKSLDMDEFRLIEQERYRLKEGMCFGEWGLIYNTERSGSALVLEDTEVVMLDKTAFMNSYDKCLAKSEIEKKKFLLNCFPSLKQIPSNKFDEIYRKFIPRFVGKGEIIINENTISDMIYVLYKGECAILKKLVQTIYTKKSKYIDCKNNVLLILNKGDIFGLERFFNGANLNKYTLVSTSDETVVFSIKFKDLSTLKNLLMKSLKSLVDNKENFLIDQMDKFQKLSKKMRIHKTIFFNNNLPIEQKIEAEEHLENKVNEMIYEALNTKEQKSQLNHKNYFNLNNDLEQKVDFTNQNYENDDMIINNLPQLKNNSYNFYDKSLRKTNTIFSLTQKPYFEKNNKSNYNNNITQPDKIRSVSEIDMNAIKLDTKFIDNEKSSILEILKKRNQIKREDLNLSKGIKKNLRLWKKMKNSTSCDFNTGIYELPLYSLNITKFKETDN